MDLIERELKWCGNTETVFFRELTGADQLALVEGQTYRGNPKKGEFEIDVALNMKSSHKLLQMTLVKSDGNQVYANLKQVAAEPAKKLKALIALANEVHKDEDEDDTQEAAGNA